MLFNCVQSPPPATDAERILSYEKEKYLMLTLLDIKCKRKKKSSSIRILTYTAQNLIVLNKLI